ncbi:MAG: hypothetical protein ACM3ML_19565 [Micromonosporaceae bacterium]
MISSATLLAYALASFVLIVIPGAERAVCGGAARSPRRLEIVGGAGGLAIIGVGLTVAVTGRRN